MTNSDSENPFQRVKALELLDHSTRYDSNAYSELCERAFESLIPAQYLDSIKKEDPDQLLLTTQ